MVAVGHCSGIYNVCIKTIYRYIEIASQNVFETGGLQPTT